MNKHYANWSFPIYCININVIKLSSEGDQKSLATAHSITIKMSSDWMWRLMGCRSPPDGKYLQLNNAAHN